MNIHSPMNAMKMIPRFRSSAKYPQQKLRRETPLSPVTKEGRDVEADIEPFLSSLQCLNDDFGSYAPVASVGNQKNTEVQPSDGDFFKLGPKEISEITNKLQKRIIEVGSDCGSSMYVDSYSFHSAETQLWNGNLTSSKELKVLATTFRVHPLDTSMTNSLCDDSQQNENEVIAPPKVVIAQEQIDGEVEVQYSPLSASTSLHHAKSTPTSSSDADTKGSNSESSSGILHPSKKSFGQYDPYGKNTDFSLELIPEAPKLVRVHRNIQFSNLDKLGRKGSLDSLLESRAIAEHDSDDSSTSLEYLMNWCGVDGAIECYDDDHDHDDKYD